MSEIVAVETEVVEFSLEDRATLDRCESTISNGIASFMEVGRALQKIRDARLYLFSHATFEEYCRDRWGLSRSYAFRQIKAAELANDPKLLSISPIPSEWVARELSKAPKALRAEVWHTVQEAAKSEGKPVSAEAVRLAIAEKLEQPKPVKVDYTDYAKREAFDLVRWLVKEWNRNWDCPVFRFKVKELIDRLAEEEVFDA